MVMVLGVVCCHGNGRGGGARGVYHGGRGEGGGGGGRVLLLLMAVCGNDGVLGENWSGGEGTCRQWLYEP